MKLQYLSFKTSNIFFVSLPPEPVGNSAMLAIGVGVTLDARRCCSVASHNMLRVSLNLPEPVGSTDEPSALFFLFSIINEMLSNFDRNADIAASKPPPLSTRCSSFMFCLDQTLLSLQPPSLQIERFCRARCSLNEKNSDDKF